MVDSNGNMNYQSDTIDLQVIFRILKRGSKFIIPFTSVISLIVIFYNVFFLKPKYTGVFQIVAREKNENQSDAIIPNLRKDFNLVSNNQKTQEFILRSPSVLQPVYKFALIEYQNRGKKYVTYQKWLSNLQISFLNKSDVLEISFMDRDKDFIIKTLDLISLKYKDYARKEKREKLTKYQDYLENQQRLLKKRSLTSLKEFNKFSIDNGLGNVDGFVSLDSTSFNSSSNLSGNSLRSKIRNIQSSRDFRSESGAAGQRFDNQLRMLEKYELLYTDYSSRFKENSKLLKDLKLKIDNLKLSLKRPNQILLKYRELKKVAFREENLLANIENAIESNKLELAKQEDPWKLISSPTIKEKVLIISFLQNILPLIFLGFILSSIIVIIREKKSGKIYELNDLKLKINCKYLDSFYLNNIYLSNKLMNSIMSKKIKDIDNDKNNFVVRWISVNHNNIKFSNNLSKVNNFLFEYSNINDSENKDDIDFVIFTIMQGIKQKDINLLNNYLKIYNGKVIGWILLDDYTDL